MANFYKWLITCSGPIGLLDSESQRYEGVWNKIKRYTDVISPGIHLKFKDYNFKKLLFELCQLMTAAIIYPQFYVHVYSWSISHIFKHEFFYTDAMGCLVGTKQ